MRTECCGVAIEADQRFCPQCGYEARIERTHYLECPCCGDDGAASDENGEFYDGQVLICGCPGWVSVDEDDDPWINNGDAPCPKCDIAAPAAEQE